MGVYVRVDKETISNSVREASHVSGASAVKFSNTCESRMFYRMILQNVVLKFGILAAVSMKTLYQCK